MRAKENDWWTKFFPTFRPLFDQLPQKSTNAELRFMVERLKLRKGQKLLDCPCGIGRISLPLAKQGVRVTGVDVTPSYLEELATKARRRGLKIETHHRDMRRIAFDREFDTAANVWTSFGYFESESDNLLVLKKLFLALKPGGKLYMSLINRDWIMVNYQPTGWQDYKDFKVLEKRSFDYSTSRNTGTWIFIKGDVQQTGTVDLRMYSCHELTAMLEKVGFAGIESYGSLKGEPVDRNRQIMYFIAHRPKA
jgi:2-polyprenyl-3-methyl-5-hydroxy-6-metoxy-1,4-benzoquinol methylase